MINEIWVNPPADDGTDAISELTTRDFKNFGKSFRNIRRSRSLVKARNADTATVASKPKMGSPLKKNLRNAHVFRGRSASRLKSAAPIANNKVARDKVVTFDEEAITKECAPAKEDATATPFEDLSPDLSEQRWFDRTAIERMNTYCGSMFGSITDCNPHPPQQSWSCDSVLTQNSPNTNSGPQEEMREEIPSPVRQRNICEIVTENDRNDSNSKQNNPNTNSGPQVEIREEIPSPVRQRNICKIVTEKDIEDAKRWKSALDKGTNKCYYYHRDSKEVRWEKPLGFDEAHNGTRSRRQTATENDIEEAKKWWATFDKTNNRYYYYHKESKEVRWNKPKGFDEAHKKKAPANDQTGKESIGGDKGVAKFWCGGAIMNE